MRVLRQKRLEYLYCGLKHVERKQKYILNFSVCTMKQKTCRWIEVYEYGYKKEIRNKHTRNQFNRSLKAMLPEKKAKKIIIKKNPKKCQIIKDIR